MSDFRWKIALRKRFRRQQSRSFFFGCNFRTGHEMQAAKRESWFPVASLTQQVRFLKSKDTSSLINRAFEQSFENVSESACFLFSASPLYSAFNPVSFLSSSLFHSHSFPFLSPASFSQLSFLKFGWPFFSTFFLLLLLLLFTQPQILVSRCCIQSK